MDDYIISLTDMDIKNNLENRVIEKVNQLSVEEIEQVEHFIDSLKKNDLDNRLTFTSTKLTESVFERVWNNPEDTEYDKL